MCSFGMAMSKFAHFHFCFWFLCIHSLSCLVSSLSSFLRKIMVADQGAIGSCIFKGLHFHPVSAMSNSRLKVAEILSCLTVNLLEDASWAKRVFSGAGSGTIHLKQIQWGLFSKLNRRSTAFGLSKDCFQNGEFLHLTLIISPCEALVLANVHMRWQRKRLKGLTLSTGETWS